ncbi:hypothetical protein DRJ48_04230 [Candidatus Woesearchaeota archaeon]|nr:MAG: hypothetical protein DRJ48_04230 [Candidatus Woesearchaeota archaeon]
MEELRGLEELLHLGAARVVHEHIGESNEGLSLLLEPEIREQIQEDFWHRVKYSISKGAQTSWERSQGMVKMKQVIQALPEFQPFLNNPTKEAYLDALRGIGAAKLAEELKAQDLSLLLEQFKRFVF